MRKNIFSTVQSLYPGRSVFNLSYEKKLTCDMGELIPVMCDEVVPGDVWEIGNEVVIRFQPMVAPILHEINCFVHYFFVPYRLLWDEWEDFITGGPDGETAPAIPTWNPTTYTEGSLWDYLGFPVGVVPADHLPISFPRDAYNFIYNNYYRDENLIDDILLTNEAILIRAWEKDYFTSSLPWQQRGTAPALPITGTTSAEWGSVYATGASNLTGSYHYSGGDIYAPGTAMTKDVLEANTIDLSSATTFDIADLRLAFAIQKWMERNARTGARYTEFLHSHFGVSPRDERLQRPEYIGGSRVPVVVSEVLQTSSTDAVSPQGNLAGHGLTVGRQFVGRYRATEYGLIMGLMSVMPRSAYQQGINRQWLRQTKYDFYFPEFSHLSEQAITRQEIYAQASGNDTIFGYAGRYDEMRTKSTMVVSGMRDTFDYWHLGRQFSSAPELNQSFIECVPDKRIFAVTDEDGLIVNFGNLIRAVRPLPIMATPGLIDH